MGEVESEAYRGAGFENLTRFTIPGRVMNRSADQVVASVYSLSYAAPHLFGPRLAEFEQALRHLLASVNPDGKFDEEMREIAVDVWRP